jgi:hypothetical protein
LSMNSQRVRDRAEATFKKKEIKQIEGRMAVAEYNAEGLATLAKTTRLKALRLARDAADTDRVETKAIGLPANKSVRPAKKLSSNPGRGGRAKG